MLFSQLSKQVEIKIQECIDILKVKVPQFDTSIIPIPEYTIKGTTAGRVTYWVNPDASCDSFILKFNQQLLKENSSEFIEKTVPHELGHIVDLSLHGKKKHYRTHGKNWKAIMDILGSEGTRCHSYDTSSVQQSRKTKTRYIYRCECESKMFHHITKQRHKKISSGMVRCACKLCKATIQSTGKIRTYK